jgi:WD40 repeat protein
MKDRFWMLLSTVCLVGLRSEFGWGDRLVLGRPPAASPQLSLCLGHTDLITTYAWQPGRLVLATGSRDHRIILWDGLTGRPMATLAGHTEAIQTLAWSPDGRLLASADTGHVVCLWDAISRRRTVLLRHRDPIQALAWGRDGRTLLTADRQSAVLWDVATMKQRVIVRFGPVPADWDVALAWSPDGNRLVTVPGQLYKVSSLNLWDARTGKRRATLTRNKSASLLLAWRPQGDLLASEDRLGISLWDAQSGRRRAQMPYHAADLPGALGWSPNGKFLTIATWGDGYPVIVWNVAAARQQAAIPTISSVYPEIMLETVPPFTWSPDSRYLAVSRALFQHTDVVVWDAVLGKARATFSFEAGDPPSHLAWSPDGQLLAIACANETAVWDVRTGKQRARLPLADSSYARLVWGLPGLLAWSPSGHRLAGTGKQPNTVSIWNGDTGRSQALLGSHQASLRRGCVKWSPDGRTIAAGSGNWLLPPENEPDSSVGAVLWDLPTGRPRSILTGFTALLDEIVWRPDSQELATTTQRTRIGGHGRFYWHLQSYDVMLWDAASASRRTAMELETLPVPLSPNGWRRYRAFHVEWSPNGRLLAKGVLDKLIVLTDAVSGEHRATLAVGDPLRDASAQPAWDLSWSPDGRSIATNGPLRQRVIYLWDAGSALLSHTLVQSVSPATKVQERLSLAWSPDGQTLATAYTHEGPVKLWNVESGRLRAILPVPGGSVNDLAWSPDGKTLAAACQDNTVVSWESATGRQRAVLRGHIGAVTSVNWSPDGRRLASGSEDGSVRLWSAATGQELAALYAIDEGKEWVVTTPTGYFTASPGAARFIQWRQGDRLWPVDRFRRHFERPDLIRSAIVGRPVEPIR